MEVKSLMLCLAMVSMISCSKIDGQDGTTEAIHTDELIFYGTPFEDVPDVGKMKIYEVSPRCFAGSGSLQAVRARLDNIKKLNINAIWIMPIFSRSETRKPYGSPYSMRDFYSIDPEYGTVEDLRQLVKDAHSRGMAVILDLVSKHTGSDCRWIKEHPDWYKDSAVFRNAAFDPASYTAAADFDWNNRELRKEFIHLMKYWIAVANIDGYRCDSATVVPDDFWTEAIDSLRHLQDGRRLILLAEAAPPSLLEDGFDLNYGWHFCDMMENLFSGKDEDRYTTEALFDVNEEEWSYDVMKQPGKSRMRFSTNHDRAAEESPVTRYGSLQGSLAAFVLSLTMGGVPMIYSSQETGYPDRLSFFKDNAAVMDWDSNPEVFGIYCGLMKLADSQVLRNGTTTPIPNEDVMSFTREYETEKWLILVNIRNRESSFSLPGNYIDCKYTDMVTGQDFVFSSTSLEAYQYLILKMTYGA